MASIKTLAELYAYFETGDKPTQAQFEDLIYTMFQGLASQPKKYVALLTQEGTNAPTDNVLLNTTGRTATWSYVGVGEYLITFTGANFDATKITLNVGWGNGSQDTSIVYVNDGTATVTLKMYQAGSPINEELYNTTFELTIYP